jgi:hypothetical protein
MQIKRDLRLGDFDALVVLSAAGGADIPECTSRKPYWTPTKRLIAIQDLFNPDRRQSRPNDQGYVILYADTVTHPCGKHRGNQTAAGIHSL